MEDIKYERAKKRVEEVKGFYKHLITYIIAISFFAVINYFVGPRFPWVLILAILWGIGLVSQGVSIFLKQKAFSKEWEERKIREYMEEE